MLVKDLPALSGSLSRHFTCVSGILVDAIEFALENGGRFELDYKRDFECRYNPRTARVLQMVMQEEQGVSFERLAATAIASSYNPGLVSGDFDDEIINSAVALYQFCNTLTLNSLAGRYHIVAGCVLLDRARRLHLVASKEIMNRCISQQLSGLDLPPLLRKRLDLALSR